MHLVACKECPESLIEQSNSPKCPICREPISLQCTRNANLRNGELHTYNTTIHNSEFEKKMNTLHTLIN